MLSRRLLLQRGQAKAGCSLVIFKENVGAWMPSNDAPVKACCSLSEIIRMGGLAAKLEKCQCGDASKRLRSSSALRGNDDNGGEPSSPAERLVTPLAKLLTSAVGRHLCLSTTHCGSSKGEKATSLAAQCYIMTISHAQMLLLLCPTLCKEAKLGDGGGFIQCAKVCRS
ncbi:hypothetical protein LMJF_31_0910 [Leishmania major strain Friedlin]|uniref:Uncharacterized protein n=1 Tax=Leishmania major TaxID=5664 RepID=Q4Q6H2_LEIMA|nr:hypothetical protein LMJF_31_0910 [Leishmania major strain Friedlin]CAG9579247.1 hypothetical_protein_-_conserved [Leishmania major strain Friedlin]CAJ08278.1 hypothetical protein LMJF_31_0910 [Leishmania major strain Friedlin]|eukprot:XP_001685076.1 hypothetical protein LMJF_31_0910 [Leishmania major strain Friedlin]